MDDRLEQIKVEANECRKNWNAALDIYGGNICWNEMFFAMPEDERIIFNMIAFGHIRNLTLEEAIMANKKSAKMLEQIKIRLDGVF